MNQYRVLRGIAIVSVLGFLGWGAEDARGSAFTVTPVRVFLGRGVNSALMNVKNDSTESIRFQISLKAWNQAQDGEMQLSDTTDLVFFPSLMELAAGEEKKVRVGSAFKAPVATEKSYRIFFEELPPSNVTATPQEQQTAAQVRVLTKMGIPIFIQPADLVLKADLTNIAVQGTQVSFDVRNMGNSFFTVTKAAVTGLSSSGATTFTREQDGWYVLAGGLRRFQFEVPGENCSATARLRIEIGSSLSDGKGTPMPIRQETTFNGSACASAQARK
jgi:fimbrial chaperone protein